MSPEQKSRSGKKPKYQIADIGGSDLTSQDVSTERVLNFLIRGEHTPAAEGASDTTSPPEKGLETVAEETTEQRPEAAVTPPETRPRKSLDHLFARASSGKAGEQTKALKPTPDAAEPISLPSPPPAEPELVVTKRVITEDRSPETVQSALPEPSASSPKPEVSPVTRSNISPPAAPAVQELPVDNKSDEPFPAVVGEPAAELARRVELWKGFYRLKDGEIEALKAMHLMAYAAGSSECYVKMHKLAEMSNLTYRYCQKVVRSLEQLGWITRLREYDPTDQLGVLYRVNLQPLNPTPNPSS